MGTAVGWKFTGSVSPGSSLTIGDVLLELSTSFGIAEVPQSLAGVTAADNVKWFTLETCFVLSHPS